MIIVMCDITSWTTVGAIGAEHWYAKLYIDDREERETRTVTLEYPVNAIEALTLNELDGFDSYKPGDLSERFRSREHARHYAEAEFRTLFPENAIMFEGIEGLRQPAPVIAWSEGLDEFAIACHRLYWEGIPWTWRDKHKPFLYDLCEKWEKLLNL